MKTTPNLHPDRYWRKVFLGFALAVGLACVLGKAVEFDRDIQPILDELSSEDRSKLIEWMRSGERLPEGAFPTENAAGELHGAELFEMEIAPLLARHCLECHDASTREGALDLSRRDAAFKGGDSGEAISPGESEHSSLWELVESDDMPENRPPLSRREKDLLARWIDEGADWTLDWIDPATYVQDSIEEDWIRRLTVYEYIETVRATTGVDISEEARELLPSDSRADGFSNTAYNLNVDLGHVNAYAELAATIVSRMDIPSFLERFHEDPKFTDKEMGKLIESMGEWILRGPLENWEVVAYRGISTTVASAGGSINEAAALIAEGMLQSPRFIYRIEDRGTGEDASRFREYEMASRLSYLIWGSSPDSALLGAAESGELRDAETIDFHVHRMLEDPRAVEQSKRFAYEWLSLGRMDNLSPNPEKFPEWKPELGPQMREETLAFFEEVVWKQGRPLSDLLNAQLTFATPELAAHYGLRKKDRMESDSEWARYVLEGDANRGGLLTQGSVLTMGGDDASMVTRGLFALHDLLRGTVNDPPPGLDTTPVASSPGQSQRAISEGRIADNSCGGCHAKFEPLAFGLERYDGLGSFKKKDVFGNRLRQDGEILFPGDAEAVEYKTSAELMDLLAESDRVAETIVWKLAQFAMGRPLGAREAADVMAISEESKRRGGTYAALIGAIATSDLMRD
ncbi:MAG: DUF1592 domain-containing protein [Verrucomicrobiota bacterium]